MSDAARKATATEPPVPTQAMGSTRVVRSAGKDQIGVFAGSLMVAGPWPANPSGWKQAKQFLIEEEYARLGPGRQALFRECMERSGGDHADLDQLYAIVVMLSKGWDRDRILVYAQPQPLRPRKKEPERRPWYEER